MLFASFLGCIEAIVRLGENATPGCVQKMNSHLTIGQVRRVLNQLEKEGYVEHELKPYGGTGKRVYHLSKTAEKNIIIIASDIEELYETVKVGY